MLKFFLLFLLTITFVSCGDAPDMPDYNKTASVELLSQSDEKIFYLLPLSGKVQDARKFWSGDFWALNQGNINLRWNALFPSGFDLISPSRELALMLTRDELMSLAPSEKFDLLLGRYDYPLKEEVYTHANRDALDWEGICNGWAPASINHNEPTPKDLTNPDGVIVPFGSADIKALLSYYYAFTHKVDSTEQIGRRCTHGSWSNWNEDCRNDLNPGSFHIVLANTVGKKGQSFLVDIERLKEVWNHPVYSYSSEVVGDVDLDEAEIVLGTSRVLRLITKVKYVDESEINMWDPILNTPVQKLTERTYVYNLFLDYQNTIIGGEWKSTDRPDFLWKMTGTKNFQGLLSGLGILLND